MNINLGGNTFIDGYFAGIAKLDGGLINSDGAGDLSIFGSLSTDNGRITTDGNGNLNFNGPYGYSWIEYMDGASGLLIDMMSSFIWDQPSQNNVNVASAQLWDGQTQDDYSGTI
jgi:hypothetical protein